MSLIFCLLKCVLNLLSQKASHAKKAAFILPCLRFAVTLWCFKFKMILRIYVCTVLLLFCPVIAGAQLSFDEGALQMGQVEWRTENNIVVNVRNSDNAAITIKDIRTSSCQLVAKWDSTAIPAGGMSQLNVTYKADLLGHFENAIYIYTDEAGHTPYILKAAGEVVREKIVDGGNFPYHVDNIWLTTDNIEFDDVSRGTSTELTIGVKNNGKSVYHPELMHLPKYLKQKAIPEKLLPGRAGKIIVTLDTRQVEGFGLKQTTVYVSRFPGDKVGEDNEMEVSAVLLPPFNNIADADSTHSPRLEVSAEELRLPSLTGRRKAKGTIVLKNSGTSPLEIRALQVFNPAVNVGLGRMSISPGKTEKLRISILSKYMKKSRRRLRVLMITNDPKRPKVIFNIKLGQGETASSQGK